MATREEYLSIAEQALQEGDEATAMAAMDEAEKLSSVQQPKEKSLLQKAGDIAMDYAVNPALEGMAAVNRGATGMVDFLASPVNAAMELSGSDARVPSLTKALEPYATGGNFMEQGLPKDVVRAAGEAVPAALAVGGALRAAAQPLTGAVTGQVGNVGTLPQLATGSESVGTGVLRQMASTADPRKAAAADAGFAALSGAGSAVGREVGGEEWAMIGAIAAPLTVAGGALALKKTLAAGKSGIDSLFGATKGMSNDGAATMLAEAMVREGLSPDDVAKQMASMGDEGMLADVAPAFSRLLRLASNKIPRIQGVASQQFAQRQSGQAARLGSALDDGTGTPLLTVDDEIARLENTMKPEITKLYDAAKNKPVAMSKRLQALMEGDNSVGRAVQKAQQNLADYRAMGEEVSNMSLINETKKILDADIAAAARAGDKGTQSRLLQLKKVMVDEADAAAPEYAQARSMFAGKEQLKNAAEQGQDFFKTSSRELKQLTETFGESERRMYKLGAKQAILDRFDNINANYDLVSRTFGKNGDAAKLRTLFDTKEQHQKFVDTLEREANWVLTRRAAQANSTTAQQIGDDVDAQGAFALARDALSSPMGAANSLGKITAGLSKKKGTQEFTAALERAGDILLEAGLKPESVAQLLRKGNAPMIERALKNQIQRRGINIPSVIGGLAQTQQQNTLQATEMQAADR